MLSAQFKQKYSYSVLLITLVMLLLVAPILYIKTQNKFIMTLIVYLPFIACVYLVSSKVRHFIPVFSIVFLIAITELINWFMFTEVCFFINHLLTISLFVYVSALILTDVLIKQKKITMDVISGILSVYILIGLLFADVYGVIQLIDENAFTGVKFIETDPLKWSVGFIYFSFVTLSTLGYGDISPNTIEAGSFVFFEAIVGQVFLTVLVARLVGIHITQNSKS